MTGGSCRWSWSYNVHRALHASLRTTADFVSLMQAKLECRQRNRFPPLTVCVSAWSLLRSLDFVSPKLLSPRSLHYNLHTSLPTLVGVRCCQREQRGTELTHFSPRVVSTRAGVCASVRCVQALSLHRRQKTSPVMRDLKKNLTRIVNRLPINHLFFAILRILYWQLLFLSIMPRQVCQVISAELFDAALCAHHPP